MMNAGPLPDCDAPTGTGYGTAAQHVTPRREMVTAGTTDRPTTNQTNQ